MTELIDYIFGKLLSESCESIIEILRYSLKCKDTFPPD